MGGVNGRVTTPALLPTPGRGGVPVVLSVNVGLPKDVDWQGRTIHTGAWKYPVEGSRMVRRLNIDGDGQGDLAGHGGEQRAVLVYQLASYWHWCEHFGRDDLTYGNLGENLTVDGMADDEVCIGDRYRIGEAELEVTQPRVTCYRVGMRLGQPEMAALLVSHHRPGFYMRVITEGHIRADDTITKTTAGPGALTVADVDALLYLPGRDPAKLRTASQIPALSPGWRQSFQEMLDEDPSRDTLASRTVEPAWTGFRSLVVTGTHRETPAVVSITVASPDETPLPVARAGEYITLRLPAAGNPAPVRNYSLSGASDAGTYRISVKQEPQGVASTYLGRALREGDTIEVAAPRGEFVLTPGTGPVIFVSAGIGVTPVLAMLHQLAAEHSQREVWWLHASRRPSEHALAGEARTLLGALAHAHERVFYSAGTSEEARGEEFTTGRLTAARLAALGLPSSATAYVCGPSSFMDDMRRALISLGLVSAHVRTELFGVRASINPGLTSTTAQPPHPPAGAPGTGPAVTFARSGLTVRFGSSGRSILELAEACDVSTRWSCRTGVCHICITPLLSGQVAYAPVPLDPPGPDEVLVCSARPTTDVVVDL